MTQRQRVQAEVMSGPQQRGAALDLQHLRRPVLLACHRFAQLLVGELNREGLELVKRSAKSKEAGPLAR